MAIPSGSGTEVLKRATKHTLTNSTHALITGVANHIYTVLSVTFCHQENATATLYMRVDVSAAGSNEVFVMANQSLASNQTFVFNDRMILSGTDILQIYTGGSANVDVVCSYIDQDWT